MNKLVSVDNDSVIINAVVELSNIVISSPSVRDDCRPWQHMITDNALECWCISTHNNLHPTSARNTLNQTDNPLTRASLAPVIFSTEKIALIHLHYKRLAVCIESAQ